VKGAVNVAPVIFEGVAVAFTVSAVAEVHKSFAEAIEKDIVEAGPVPDPFVPVTLTLNVPAAVGVPEITPVVVFKVNPVGNVPLAIAKLVGELVAIIVYEENAEFTVPVNDAGVITGVVLTVEIATSSIVIFDDPFVKVHLT